CDGYANYQLSLKAKIAFNADDLRLEIPLDRRIATYMMGLGRKGGFRPAQWQWRWNSANANNEVWIGDANAGLHLKLKHLQERWDICWLNSYYEDWAN